MKTMIDISDMFHDDTNIYCYNIQVANMEGIMYYTNMEFLEKTHPRVAKCIRMGFRLSRKTVFEFKVAGAYIQLVLV